MGDLHLDRIVQRNRLHYHFNRMIAVVAAAGHIQRQIDLRAPLHDGFSVRDFGFIVK